jgi:phosphoglycolate phosphatase-like HAD superfamily hydrolase
MSNQAASTLEAFEKRHEFYVGFDSDGCVFDSMELKHKECFCPAFINTFELQAVSRYAREVWEFVNLYSRTRGVNRFRAVLRALELAAARPEVQERGVEIPRLPELAAWVERESKLGNPQLEADVASRADADLELALRWSSEVNAAVAKIVRGVPPFPAVTPVLERLQGQADVIVVSQTPAEALVREWAEQEIDRFVSLIAGQELGTKAEHLAATAGGYEAGHVLMIGDAPGDLRAAESVGALFYPILPGREEESWERLKDEAMDRFFAGSYAGDYAEKLRAEFDAVLPEVPPWSES